MPGNAAISLRGERQRLIALPNSFSTTHGDVIIAAASRYGLPLIGTPDFPRAGGLMTYSSFVS
jgi:hypothetical protein